MGANDAILVSDAKLVQMRSQHLQFLQQSLKRADLI